MSADIYDESEWPVVVVTAAPMDVTAEMIEAIYQHVDRWLARGERIGFIMDNTAATKVSSEARKQVSKELAARREIFGRSVVAGLVFPNPWLRGAVTAVHWLNPPNYPWGVFGTASDAKRWARAQLGGHPTSASP